MPPCGCGTPSALGKVHNWAYQYVISLSLPLPVDSVKPSPQPTEQAGDGEKNRRMTTVNPAHMGKAFKVMNELRRYLPPLPLPSRMEPNG